jgi:hypothetical protein
MGLFTSPILWVVTGLFYFFFTRSSAPKVTSLSVFALPTDVGGGVKEVITSNGTKVTGASITSLQATVLSNRLLVLFGEFLSSESDIVAVFEGLNRADFILVYDKFGTSHQRSFFGNEGIGSNGEDLIQWLSREVTSESNFDKLKMQFPDLF